MQGANQLRASARRSVPSSDEAPAIVHRVLQTQGQPLDASARAPFERRFNHDFSRVRVHADGNAASSAHAVNSLAYTVGRDIVFGAGQYDPRSAQGRRLLAHELTHVVQQRALYVRPGDEMLIDSPGSADEMQARRGAPMSSNPQHGPARLMRADPDAVGQVRKLRTVIGAGIQFFPQNLSDTQIGPVSAQGGLLSSGASQLVVILGENLTPRILAREILPLWTTATPFNPPGGGAPVAPGALTEVQLAQGLLAYNQYYLGLPSMTRWRAGLRFPLPVEVDPNTGMSTVNADVIRSLAASLDPAFAPALDTRATSSAAPPAATVQADVQAFLAEHASAQERGIHLGARAVSNAQAELPFIRQVFAQVGAAGQFDLALEMMDSLVNREIQLLAMQRDGTAILALVQTALATAVAGLGADIQTRLTRANDMLARVAGVAATAPSASVPTRAEKTVTVDTLKLQGSRFNPVTQVQVANAIYAQCNVRFTHGIDATATAAQTTTFLGADAALRVASSCGAISAEESAMYRGARAAFGLGARIQAFFVPRLTGINASGYSLPRYCATGPAAPFRDVAVVENSGDTSTLAHEAGHILLNSGGHPSNTIMQGRPRPNEITDPQCTTIYNNA
jgi:hypothetical protein